VYRLLIYIFILLDYVSRMVNLLLHWYK